MVYLVLLVSCTYFRPLPPPVLRRPRGERKGRGGVVDLVTGDLEGFGRVGVRADVFGGWDSPAKSTMPFVVLIVDFPVLQIVNIVRPFSFSPRLHPPLSHLPSDQFYLRAPTPTSSASIQPDNGLTR